MTRPDRLAIAAITIYQRYLSPYKGFCCAHRVLHGGPSCSEYARQTILACGWRRSLATVRDRLRACRGAALQLTVEDESERKKRRRDQVLECLPDACPDLGPDAGPDSCDAGCIPDSCGRLGKLRGRRLP
jgi:putative component of membrane protein insertase Oxa1/YidC/SpoIIIJ protein YidD